MAQADAQPSVSVELQEALTRIQAACVPAPRDSGCPHCGRCPGCGRPYRGWWFPYWEFPYQPPRHWLQAQDPGTPQVINALPAGSTGTMIIQ